LTVDCGLQPSDKFIHRVGGTLLVLFVVDGSDINRKRRITKDLMVRSASTALSGNEGST